MAARNLAAAQPEAGDQHDYLIALLWAFSSPSPFATVTAAALSSDDGDGDHNSIIVLVGIDESNDV